MAVLARVGGAGWVSSYLLPPCPFIFIFLYRGPSFLELTCGRLQGPRYCPVQTSQVIGEEAEARSSEGGPCLSGQPFGCSAAVSPLRSPPPSLSSPPHLPGSCLSCRKLSRSVTGRDASKSPMVVLEPPASLRELLWLRGGSGSWQGLEVEG